MAPLTTSLRYWEFRPGQVTLVALLGPSGLDQEVELASQQKRRACTRGLAAWGVPFEYPGGNFLAELDQLVPYQWLHHIVLQIWNQPPKS